MKHLYKCTALVLSAVLLLGMSGCSQDSPLISSITGITASTTTASTTEAPVLEINPLTGESDMEGSTSSRLFGVMIANNDFIQDAQVGIADADMWMEAETEAGITRIMAVFSNTSRVPESIGPIRSARSPFVHVAEALGIAFAHAGGSQPALNNIANADIGDIDLDTGDGQEYSWRDMEYYQEHDYEFCLRTSGEDMTQYLIDHNYSTVATRTIPWTFGTQSGEDATYVRIRMSASQTISFEYDAEDGVYDKYNGSDEVRHCDINGTPIRTGSILVLYTDKFWETDETIDFYLQNGTGTLFSQGKTRQFNWSRSSDGFVMTELDGSQLTLGTGKIYLCVVSTEYEGSLEYSALTD